MSCPIPSLTVGSLGLVVALGGTLFYENSDRSEYTGKVFGGLTYVKFDSWEIGIVPIEEGSLRQ